MIMDSSRLPCNENPRKNASVLSVFLITWIWPLLYKGSKEGLTQNDLTKTLKVDKSERLGDELEREWTKEQANFKGSGNTPRLKIVMLKAYYKSFIYNGILVYSYVWTRTWSSMILGQLLKRYQEKSIPPDNLHKQNTTTRSSTYKDNGASPKIFDIEGYLYYIWDDKIWLTTLLVLISFISAAVYHHFELQQKLLGSRMRVACCSLIYRKVLRLSKKTSEEISVGYVVNLVSTDAARLDYAFLLSHYLWITLVHSGVLCYILYDVIGVAAFIGVFGLLLKVIPLHSFLCKMSAKLRLKVAVSKDKRVGIMNELINGILVIKMYAWEKPFQTVVAKARRLEIKQIRSVSFIIGVSCSSFIFVERSTLFITIVAMLYFNIPINAEIVFSLAQYFSLLQLVAALGFSNALSMMTEGFVSIKRIEQFLNLGEHDPGLNGLIKEKGIMESDQPVLKFNNVIASWTDTKTKTVENVNFNVFSGKLCAIIGAVGSGKSSLLQLILGELPIQSGNIKVKGSVSYASQEPWLFPGTVRNNILFGQTFNKKRYNEVIRCCALTTDLQQFSHGDKTLVGERGALLSGGQKARISLARAIYKVANIYLFDDPLSAVDTNVGQHLYNEAVGPNGYLSKKGATRILVTHQVYFLKEADSIIFIEDGKISQQGTYEDHFKAGLDLSKILKSQPSQDKTQAEVHDKNNHEANTDKVTEDYSLLPRSESIATTKSTQSLYETPEVIAEHQAEGLVALKVWTRYFRGGGSIYFLSYALFLFVFSQILTSGFDYFIKTWIQQEFFRANNQPTSLTTHECLYIYTALVVGLIILILLRCYTFFVVCMRASKTIHNDMFTAMLQAPMRFFETNSSGKILNRFSRDMGSMDEQFPRCFLGFLQVFCTLLGTIIVVVVINPKILLALGIAMVFYILLVLIYLRSAQDLKRLEAITRSPVLGHLSATISGLTTIRVNYVQQEVTKEFDELQNVHTNAWQLIHSSNSTCGIWLDFISCTFVGFVAFNFIFFEKNTFAGDIGLALSQTLMLTGIVQRGIRQTTESLQLMTCIERVLEYCDIKPEYSPSKKPIEKWPEHGKITFDDMSYCYDDNLPPVLKNINMQINPGWKVGIVGRTGAGKSSLIGALFRLAQIKGKILIDDIDTGSISLESLRQNIAIIPQDPVLFSAPIRYNLDPFSSYTDEQLWKVLDAVELKNKIQYLDYQVTEGGSNFSVGQRQLICLARALLRKNKIFVLDEATANVDPQTDILIQKTIRAQFFYCTVITIAHRLHTVMDSDRVLVMDAGVAKEFDIPHILLQNRASYLSEMVAATGENESNALRKIAEEAYNIQKTEK